MLNKNLELCHHEIISNSCVIELKKKFPQRVLLAQQTAEQYDLAIRIFFYKAISQLSL